MAITDKKISVIYPGRDISSLSDRPNQDGMTATELKARFDQLGKEIIPKINSLIDELFADLYSGTEQTGHTHNIDNLVDGLIYKLFTAVERAKLGAIAEGAEVNQNAFSNVKVGSTTIASTTKTDTFELVAGLNVSIAVDALTKKITFSATGDLATEAVQSLIVDLGEYYTSLNVEGALQEIGLSLLNKVDKVAGKGLSTEDYTSTEKTKLSGISENANNYVHPATHLPSIIEQDENNRFVTDTEKTSWNGKQDALVSGTNIKTINGNSVLGSGDLVIESGDWKSISETLTYASADSPTFVANTSVDLTSVISVGMKLKLTQATVKYFIVTAITSTTITLYGGTDYTLANATITLPYFSSMKAPFGFPLNPDKWTIIITSTTSDASQLTPTIDVWYNLGGLSISIPIGVWNCSWKVALQVNSGTSTGGRILGTISTTNNSETIPDFTIMFNVTLYQLNIIASAVATKTLALTSKTTHYFLGLSKFDAQLIKFDNNESAMVFKAVCAYL